MKSQSDLIFEEMTKKATVILRRDRKIYLTCEDHPTTPLQKSFDGEGYLECRSCGWRITLAQARTLVNDILVSISELFDWLDSAMCQDIPVFDNDSSHSIARRG